MKNVPIKTPKKPGIPTLLIFALVFWGGCAFVYASSPLWLKDGEIELPIKFLQLSATQWIHVICILITIISSCWLLRKKHINYVALCFLSISLATFLGLMAAQTQQAKEQQISKLENGNYQLYIVEDSRQGSYNSSVTAELFDKSGKIYKVKLQYQDCDHEIHAGEHITADCKITKPSDNQQSSYWQNGICATVKATNIQKVQASDILTPIFNFRDNLINTIRSTDMFKEENYSEAEQLLSAIICGQRIDINSGDVYTWFKNAGLAHLVAVSGAHLSLVTGLLIVLLKRLKVKRKTAIFCQSLFIFGYLVCAAIPISALRAAFMSYTTLYAFLGKRRSAPLNGLALCIIVLIAINPQTSVSVSFALSAGSTIGIILFGNLLSYYILNNWPKAPEFITGAISMTLAANVCTLPLSISIFGQIPLIAPVSNIICAPIFTILCGLGLVCSIAASLAISVFPALANFIMMVPYIISWVLVKIVYLLANLPYSTIEATLSIYAALAISLILSFVLYITWPKQSKLSQLDIKTHEVKIISESKKTIKSNIVLPSKRKKTRFLKPLTGIAALIVVAFIIASFIKLPGGSETEIVMFDVGQGDSILIKSKGQNYLIDTGNQDKQLQECLNNQGVNHLNGLIITHPDDDHCGSIDQLKNTTKIDKFYCAKDLTTNTSDNSKKLMNNIKSIVEPSNIVCLDVGDKISFGEIVLEVIWPDKYTDNGSNGDSLTLKCAIDIYNDNKIDATALFCGDAEKKEIEKMQSKNRIGKIDIYKVGHHGSKNAITEQSSRTLNPSIVLFSVGANNKYGHPSQSIINLFENLDSKIYRTDKDGTTTLSIMENSIQVKTSK